MKPLFLRPQNDIALLHAVGTRSGAQNACVIKHKDRILTSYRLYKEVVKRPGAMKAKVSIPQDLQDAFGQKYSEGRDGEGAFSYIRVLEKAAHTVSCPYCGRKGLGTVDHYLPQKHFAVFSVFSVNMIPACYPCQLKKGSRYSNGSARPIHPLLDRIGLTHETIIRSRIDVSGELAASKFIFSSQHTHLKARRTVRKKEALLLKQHYRFFELDERDEVIADCGLELNGLRSRLYRNKIASNNPVAVRRWMEQELAETLKIRDKTSSPFLLVLIIRGFLNDEHAMMKLANSHVPVAEFTLWEEIDMLKER